MATSPHPLLSAFLATCLLGWLAAAAPAGAAQPTRTTITLDGSFDDWQTVLANPFNRIVDGDGSSVPCAESIDRDCIVSKDGGDIRRMAITWDEQNLYLYVERMQSANNKVFLLYLDRSHDGRFGGADYILEHAFKASQNEIESTKRWYLPLDPTGDPTEDALGFGDGYTPPGGASNDLAGPDDPGVCTTCASADGLAFEFAWPWAALGITAQQAVIYHLSSAGSATAAKEDNLGGPDDRRGSTRFVSHALDDPLIRAGGLGEPVRLPHAVTNTGNWPDRLSFEVTSALGMEVCLYTDLGGGAPGDLIGCDIQGNGDWSDNGDVVTPAFDTDGDGAPDTDILQPGESFSFVGEIVPANKHNRRVETTRFRTISSQDPLVTPSVSDETVIGNVTVIPRRSIKTTPGSTFHLPHLVASHLPTQDTFDVSWTSSLGWTYTPWSDPNADGDPSDGVPLFDTDGDTDPDVNVPSGGTFPIVMVGEVPAGAALGIREELLMEARSTGAVRGEILDEILVARSVELRPDHTFSSGTGKAGSASHATFFRHYLTWNGEQPARFDLIGLSSEGYVVDFFTDPNGDGNPADGELLSEPVLSPPIDPFGGTWTFLTRVSIPLWASGGTVDRTEVFALHEDDPSLSDMVADETRVTLVQAFQDPGHTVAISHSPLCATVYARATGLFPGLAGQYRIVWTDPSGTDVRVTPFTPDGSGEGFDSLEIGPTVLLGQWSLAVQEYDGAVWSDLDRSFLEVENEGSMDALFTDKPSYSIAEKSLTVSAVFRNNGFADLGPLDISFRILTPAEDQILRSNGTYRSFNGQETTWDLKNLSLPAGQQVTETFSVVDLTWPVAGQYHLDALWANACNETVAVYRRTFFVTEDSDGDGLTDDVEETNGLDWTDRDTDDDGLLDGDEGLADSDGDTVLDALSCDSDGDGLADSLESGLGPDGLDPDTDLTAGCFVADGDAGATTTSRLVADTDGGGVADGDEDVDRDGVVDPGEKDPNRPSDDPCATTAPLEVEGVMVRSLDGDVVLSWQGTGASDPCVEYRVWEAPLLRPSLVDFVEAADGLGTPSWGRPAVSGSKSFLIQATSPFGGDGPLGYTGP